MFLRNCEADNDGRQQRTFDYFFLQILMYFKSSLDVHHFVLHFQLVVTRLLIGKFVFP